MMTKSQLYIELVYYQLNSIVFTQIHALFSRYLELVENTDDLPEAMKWNFNELLDVISTGEERNRSITSVYQCALKAWANYHIKKDNIKPFDLEDL